MKKVLIITYYFNRTTEIGSQRLRGLAKYLSEFGWEPLILTVKTNTQSDNFFNVIETSHEDIYTVWKKRFNFNPNETIKKQMGCPIKKDKNFFIDYISYIFNEIFAYPDIYKDWYSSAVKQGKKIFKNNKIDAIISSSSPPTSHLIANKLREIYQVPWLADFRDLWTQNHYYSHTSIRRLIERKLEIKTLSTADALVTTTPYFAKDLEKLHKKRTYSITNGFNSDEDNIMEVTLKDKFIISYTGTLYNGKHDPIKLFEGLNELISDGIIKKSDIEIRFFSEIDNWLETEIKSCNLEKIVKLYGFVDHKTALKKQRESQILLLLLWDHPKVKGVAPAKIFEYLAAKKPILAIGGPKGFIKEILDETNAGLFALSKDEIKDFLVKSYQQWKQNGKVSYHGNEQNINKYSQREMAKKFSELLNHITK